MRKASAISFLSLLIFQSVLLFPLSKALLEIHYHQVRKELKEGKEEGERVQLFFSHEEVKKKLHWEKPDEFEYKGRMYDVIEREATKEGVRFTVYPDHEESRLREAFHTAHEGKKEGEKPSSGERCFSPLKYQRTTTLLSITDPRPISSFHIEPAILQTLHVPDVPVPPPRFSWG